ncbi:MAG TPA: transporter substrate-binding domain-containing protein [Candidatus Limnocylindria bacterium]|nr:transporter substrate-binding domain-containing protein [Candidatus Limnocylindria bacterium]
MNRITPIIVFSTIVLASAGLFWYAKNSSLVIDTNTLLVDTNAEYPPFSFLDNDTIVGFDIDLANEVGKRLGKTVKITDMPFDSLLPKLQLGDLNIIAAGLTATPERAEKVLFTKPYLEGDPLIVIVGSKNPAITGIADLHGKDIVVNEGYTADLQLSKIEGLSLKRLATPAEAFMALQSGQVYAFVAARSTVQPYFQEHTYEEFNITPLEGMSDHYSLAVSKKYPELLPVIQEALDALEKDGTLAALKQKWGLS